MGTPCEAQTSYKTPKAWAVEDNVSFALRSCCTVRAAVSNARRQAAEWEEILALCTTDRELIISKIYQELQKLNTRKTSNSVKKNRTNDRNRYFSKDEIGKANNHMKKKKLKILCY